MTRGVRCLLSLNVCTSHMKDSVSTAARLTWGFFREVESIFILLSFFEILILFDKSVGVFDVTLVVSIVVSDERDQQQI